MKHQSHISRVQALELALARGDDAEVLRWGEAVTDDELRLVANLQRSAQKVRTSSPWPYSDSDLYLMIKPYIDELRAG